MRVVNQITFEAKDDAEALRLAAERLGQDAVILSTRVVREGGFLGLFRRSVLRVTAGILEEGTKKETKAKFKDKPQRENRVDEDTRRENLIAFQKLMEFKERSSGGKMASPTTPTGDEGYQTAGTTATGVEGDSLHVSSEALRSAYGLNGGTPAEPHSSTLQPIPPAPPQAPSSPQPTVASNETKILKNQVGVLSERIDSLLERLAMVETGSTSPLPATGESARPQDSAASSTIQTGGFQAGLPVSQEPHQLEETSIHYSFNLDERILADRLRASDVDERYIRKLLADYGVSDRRTPFKEWLASRIECAGDEGGEPSGGRKVMLLGPTGVGKTTTIAKLAAIQALWEHKKVLLLTSDTYRIAAVDQLKTYAKILGVPIEIVFEAEALPAILEEHGNADIILLDTAGRAQRDKKSLEVFEELYDTFAPDAVHLVLAANMKYTDMLDVVEHIPNIPVSHLLFTKLDETVSFGAIFNIQQVMGCPVSFLTAGQNVPKDIETASGSRIAEFLMMSEEERKRG
ncbi:MAG: flagellar biosynthesis protein FlhF [Fretibacterium sp.]|nr:flagellar biosynthesis protein FlhF [Fretibacterium sp.]